MRYAFATLVFGWSAVAQAGINDKLPPEAYRDPIDQQIARTGKGVPGRPSPCAYERDGGRVIESQPTELCVEMLPQQRWRGLWRNAMEGSTFCPEPATVCSTKKGEQIWLSKGPGGGGHGELYRVDFIGRRTMYKGPYGMWSLYDQEVVMDEVIKMELLEDPLSKTAKAALKK